MRAVRFVECGVGETVEWWVQECGITVQCRGSALTVIITIRLFLDSANHAEHGGMNYRESLTAKEVSRKLRDFGKIKRK